LHCYKNVAPANKTSELMWDLLIKFCKFRLKDFSSDLL